MIRERQWKKSLINTRLGFDFRHVVGSSRFLGWRGGAVLAWLGRHDSTPA